MQLIHRDHPSVYKSVPQSLEQQQLAEIEYDALLMNWLTTKKCKLMGLTHWSLSIMVLTSNMELTTYSVSSNGIILMKMPQDPTDDYWLTLNVRGPN